MLVNEEQRLIDKFIATIEVVPNNTRELFAIGFTGLTGVGKTFFAAKLSEKLGLYVANNDKIRRFLNDNGFEGSSPAQHLVFQIGPASSKFLYENKISHIIDADLMQYYQITKQNAEKYGSRLFIIEMICPENIILERIEKRDKEILRDPNTNLSRVGKDEYFKRKKLYESLLPPETFFTIDTSKEIDIQLDSLIDKLKEEKVL